MILVSLAAVASAAPQIVPYEHVEIAADPYVHEEPELSDLALGIINRNRPAVAPAVAPAVSVGLQHFAAPQQFAVAPQQFAAPAAGVWTGTCLNNLGQGVACRAVEVEAPVAQQQFVPQARFVPQAQFVAQQQFVQPAQFAAPVQAVWNGACINNLGEGVPCSQ